MAVLGTGGQEGITTEYRYGESDKALSQIELERRLAGGEIDAGALKNVVMIQREIRYSRLRLQSDTSALVLVQSIYRQ